MSSSRPSPGFHRFLALLAITAILGLAVGVLLGRERHYAPDVDLSTLDVSALYGTDIDGERVWIVPPGGGFILIASETCPHCHDTLSRIREAAGDAPLPHLYVVVLEGAQAAERLVEDTGGAGVVALGAFDTRALVDTLHLTSTPLLLQVTAEGRVTAAEIGALSPARAAEVVRASR